MKSPRKRYAPAPTCRVSSRTTLESPQAGRFAEVTARISARSRYAASARG
jgi:hypothetical protein